MLALAVVAAALCAAVAGGHARRTGTVEVVYTSRRALAVALHRHPAQLVRVLAPLRVAEVRPGGPPGAYAATLRRQAGIVAAQVPVRRAAAGAVALALGRVSTPAGGAYEWQYYATGVDRVPPAVKAAAARITIAVVDTGADLSAPGLRRKVVGSYDVRTSGHSVVDRNGHGTFVASLAGGASDGPAGIAGFGGDARLLVVKVADSPAFDDVDVAAGIVYAVRHGARIVNLSVAGRAASPVERAAVRYATRHGVLLVAAAGNDALAGDPPEYPAALLQPGASVRDGVGLSVGASGMTGQRAAFSESGPFVSLAAPGASVFGEVAAGSQASAFPRSALAGSGAGLYGFASGTSFAAPEVAGAAALVWAAAPRLSAQQVAEVLKETASGDGSWTPALGFGVLDVAAAVERATSLQAG